MLSLVAVGSGASVASIEEVAEAIGDDGNAGAVGVGFANQAPRPTKTRHARKASATSRRRMRNVEPPPSGGVVSSILQTRVDHGPDVSDLSESAAERI